MIGCEVSKDVAAMPAGSRIIAGVPGAGRCVPQLCIQHRAFRDALAELEITPCIPGRANRKAPIPDDADR